MRRLAPIEGLRAYLALWVLLSHVLEWSGYTRAELPGPLWLLGNGRLAVEVFIIVSGFVIFHLLANQSQTYGEFVIRRFFRLYPAFLVFFLVAIAVSGMAVNDLAEYSHRPAASTIELLGIEQRPVNAWDIAAHLTMLHGVVPNAAIPHEPLMFLAPSWSISLEWQFYLVAPLMFLLMIRGGPRQHLELCCVCVAILAIRRWLPFVDNRAALPFSFEYFFLGGFSYALYVAGTNMSEQTKARFSWLLIAVIFSGALFAISGNSHRVLPVCGWVIFLGLLLEFGSTPLARFLLPVFNNPVAQFIGRVSYSLYLCHWIVIIACQAFLLSWWPELPKVGHFAALLGLSAAVSVMLSYLGYTTIEAPGIHIGRYLTSRHPRPILAGSLVRPVS